MKISYARVSTEEQSLDRQIDILRQAGCDRIMKKRYLVYKRRGQSLIKY